MYSGGYAKCFNAYLRPIYPVFGEIEMGQWIKTWNQVLGRPSVWIDFKNGIVDLGIVWNGRPSKSLLSFFGMSFVFFLKHLFWDVSSFYSLFGMTATQLEIPATLKKVTCLTKSD